MIFTSSTGVDRNVNKAMYRFNVRLERMWIAAFFLTDISHYYTLMRLIWWWMIARAFPTLVSRFNVCLFARGAEVVAKRGLCVMYRAIVANWRVKWLSTASMRGTGWAQSTGPVRYSDILAYSHEPYRRRNAQLLKWNNLFAPHFLLYWIISKLLTNYY
jgi:hypothetical protein